MGLIGARHASARASASAEFQSEGLSSHEPRLARLLSGDTCLGLGLALGLGLGLGLGGKGVRGEGWGGGEAHAASPPNPNANPHPNPHPTPGEEEEEGEGGGAHLDPPRAVRGELSEARGSRGVEAGRGGRVGRGVEGGAGREAQAVLGQAALERRPLHRQQLARVVVILATRLLALVRMRVRGEGQA